MNPPHCPAPGGRERAPASAPGVEQQPRGPRPRARRLWPWLAVAGALPLAWCCVDRVAGLSSRTVDTRAAVAESTDAGPAPVVTDVSRDGTLAAQAGRTLPQEPAGWQKRAPCDASNRDEEAVHGACYVRVPRRPPCKPAQYEYAGACFEAVSKAKRPDTSMDATP